MTLPAYIGRSNVPSAWMPVMSAASPRRAAPRGAASGPCRSRSRWRRTVSMPFCFDELGERRGVGVGEVVLEARAVDREDVFMPYAPSSAASASTPLADHDGVALLRRLAGGVLARPRTRPASSSETCRADARRRRERYPWASYLRRDAAPRRQMTLASVWSSSTSSCDGLDLLARLALRRRLELHDLRASAPRRRRARRPESPSAPSCAPS